MLVDANILLYTVDLASPHQSKATAWLGKAFAGRQRIGLPWQTIGAFLRISTNPRLFRRPLSAEEAWTRMGSWLEAPNCWVPAAGTGTARILGDFVTAHDIRSTLVTDAQLAALAIEHGVPVVSADTDFARFPDLRWINPISSQT